MFIRVLLTSVYWVISKMDLFAVKRHHGGILLATKGPNTFSATRLGAIKEAADSMLALCESFIFNPVSTGVDQLTSNLELKLDAIAADVADL